MNRSIRENVLKILNERIIFMNIASWIDINELLPILKNNNCGLEIQFFANPTILDNPESFINELSEKLSSECIEIALHGPFSELVPASRDKAIRDVTFNRFRHSYQIAKAFNANSLILHTGFIPKTYMPKDWVKASTEFWNEFLLDRNDINVHIENVYEDDYLLISEVIEKVNKPNFSICLDIGHVNANSSKSLEYWITGISEKIGYVHIHNNDGIFDNHWGLHHGTIDMLKTLTSLKEHAPKAKWSIESSEVLETIDWLNQNSFIV